MQPDGRGSAGAGTQKSELPARVRLIHWPTPAARDYFPAHNPEYIAAKKAKGHGMSNLNDTVHLAPWPTPLSIDSRRGVETDDARMARGANTGTTLNDAAAWATPNARDFKVGSSRTYLERTGDPKGDSLSNQAAAVAMWPTPVVPNGGRVSSTDRLSATGVTLDGRKHSTTLEHAVRFVGSGQTPFGYPAGMEKTGQLNPAFSLWLQGFPAEWGSCAPRAMPSSRKLPPNLYEP